MIEKQANKKTVTYYFKMIQHLPREDKRELINKLHFSILHMHERRLRQLKKEGKDIWSGLTPDELEVYLKDTRDGC